MKRLVLFDIDGTLLWTDGAGRSAIRRALADELNMTNPFEGVRFDGKTDPQIVGEILELANYPDPHNGAHIGAVCNRYVDLLTEELQSRHERIRVFPGVREVLDAIEKRRDVVLGLLTGNVERGAVLKLAAAGLRPERFSVGAFGSDAPNRADLPAIAVERAKWGPKGHEVVIIGDTPADMTCGNGIGARAIGVATGSYSVEELRAAGADTVFESFESVSPVVESILA